MPYSVCSLRALLLVALAGCATSAPPVANHPRVVVTTDPELDDANSLIRYLLYSTDFRTEGLIYASSGFHWKGDGSGKKLSVPNREYSRFGLNLCPCESWRWTPDEHFIDVAVATYEQMYPNLRVHDRNYPTPAELKTKIRWGNVEFDGDIAKDTPGSDLIKALLLDDEPGPVYLLAWGGHSTIARALKSVQEQYSATPGWSAIYQKVSRKAILSPPAIRTTRTRTTSSPTGPTSVGDGKQMVQGDIFDYCGLSEYTADQLKAKGYIVWTPPRPKGEFLGEGDTFTFLNLLDYGLVGYGAQNDFTARLRWSVTPTYAGANHEPRVTIRGRSRISARPGETIRLQGVVSDPDENVVTVRWWQWKDVGAYPGRVTLTNPSALATSIRVPSDASAGQTIHLILEATDNGTPPLTRYQRVIISVTH